MQLNLTRLQTNLRNERTQRNGYSLLTNFDEKQITVFKISVELYNGPYQLKIQEGTHGYKYGLWFKNGTDIGGLSDFWNIHNVIKL